MLMALNLNKYWKSIFKYVYYSWWAAAKFKYNVILGIYSTPIIKTSYRVNLFVEIVIWQEINDLYRITYLDFWHGKSIIWYLYEGI